MPTWCSRTRGSYRALVKVMGTSQKSWKPRMISEIWRPASTGWVSRPCEPAASAASASSAGNSQADRPIHVRRTMSGNATTWRNAVGASTQRAASATLGSCAEGSRWSTKGTAPCGPLNERWCGST
eukprot:scaffold158_cov126-Isochrysis_galbana.AAC.7